MVWFEHNLEGPTICDSRINPVAPVSFSLNANEIPIRDEARNAPNLVLQKLVETRLATGEPYIVFGDTVNRAMPRHHRELGFKVTTSNLCSEITLPTGRDHLGNDRTAVCCLSSLNLETWAQWKDDKRFIEDVMRFLDNVLTDYINRAPPEMARAKYSATS